MCTESSDVLTRFSRFSNWFKMKKCVARIFRLNSKSTERQLVSKTSAKGARNESRVNLEPLRVEELQRAEGAILQLVQSCAFPCEVEALQKIQMQDCQSERNLAKAKKFEIKRSSALYRLDPILDENGLVRVGGRLAKSAEFPEDFKHPVILPKKSFVIDLIIRDAHEKVAHAGRGITLSALRNQYWIVNANSVVRHLISKCVVCCHLRSPVGEQKMADLPKERLTPAPPFTYCGVDYFGPFRIKEGRKELKRYGVLFTCLSSRAVHIKAANSLETNSFLNALRHFIARIEAPTS